MGSRMLPMCVGACGFQDGEDETAGPVTVVCTKMSDEDAGKQFSYKTLFSKEMVDVKKLSRWPRVSARLPLSTEPA